MPSEWESNASQTSNIRLRTSVSSLKTTYASLKNSWRRTENAHTAPSQRSQLFGIFISCCRLLMQGHADSICRRHPSDSVSPRTPLSLAIAFPLSGRLGDLHLLEYTHAGRTAKRPFRNIPKGALPVGFTEASTDINYWRVPLLAASIIAAEGRM